MNLDEFIKRIEDMEKNVDRVLKAARLERRERAPMDFERLKFMLYFVAGMTAMIMGFIAAFMVIYFANN